MKALWIMLLIVIVVSVLALMSADEKIRMYKDSLKERTDSLRIVQSQFKSAEEKYKKTETKLQEQELFTNGLIKQVNEGLTPVKNAIKSRLKEDWKSLPDSQKIASCDTLRELVRDLTKRQEAKDSLTELSKINFQQQINEKDTFILACAEANHYLSAELTSTFVNLQIIAKENQQLQSKLKRRKTFNRILLGAVTVLGGITAVHFIK